MNLSVNSSIASFLLAVLVYILFGALIDAGVKDEPAKGSFKIVLLVICIVIALAGSIFIHV